MLLLISPAKTLDYSTTSAKQFTQPRLLEESNSLVKVLKKKSPKQLQKLMSVSENIATLNTERYNAFSSPFNLENAKQALFAFKGDVYLGLNAESFNKRDLNFAQSHLRILSGLYGLLKPLDLMQAYRLEMGTKLKSRKGKNLYEFWGNKITNLINEDLSANNESILINLASKEYFRSVKTKNINANIINIHFKEERNGQFKIISFSAKKARGMMAHFVIKNKIKIPEHLKAFDYENYLFNESMSDENNFVFTR